MIHNIRLTITILVINISTVMAQLIDYENIIKYDPLKIKLISSEEAKNFTENLPLEKLIVYDECYEYCSINNGKIIAVDCQRQNGYMIFPSMQYMKDYIYREYEDHIREVSYFFMDKFNKQPIVVIHGKNNVEKLIAAFPIKRRVNVNSLIQRHVLDQQESVYELSNNQIFWITYNDNIQPLFGYIINNLHAFLYFIDNFYAKGYFTNVDYGHNFIYEIDNHISLLPSLINISKNELDFTESSLEKLSLKTYIALKEVDENLLIVPISAYLYKYLLQKYPNSKIEIVYKSVIQLGEEKTIIYPQLILENGKIYNIVVSRVLSLMRDYEYLPYRYFTNIDDFLN